MWNLQCPANPKAVEIGSCATFKHDVGLFQNNTNMPELIRSHSIQEYDKASTYLFKNPNKMKFHFYQFSFFTSNVLFLAFWPRADGNSAELSIFRKKQFQKVSVTEKTQLRMVRGISRGSAFSRQ